MCPVGPRTGSSSIATLHPQESPFHPRFEAFYEERYQACYGVWPPIIGTVVREFQGCGGLKQGFAQRSVSDRH